jgi:hypothetical protein
LSAALAWAPAFFLASGASTGSRFITGAYLIAIRWPFHHFFIFSGLPEVRDRLNPESERKKGEESKNP